MYVCFVVLLALKEVQAELIQMYTDITKSVDVLPCEDSAGLPLADIFAPLLIEEDLKVKERMANLNNPSGKELKSLREVFCVDNKPAKRIFMKGDAGCGKTLFCLKMLDTWCQVKQSGTVIDDALQQCLAVFDLVFYIPIRYFNGDVTFVKNMITQTVSEQCQNLLGKSQIHSLVILDGLDEAPVVFRELPSMHGIVSYVLFCTTRPWKFTQLQLKFRPDDKVVQILGLLPSSEAQVIEYVLVNFYKLAKVTEEFKMKFNRYSEMAKSSSMASLVKIPMMLTACCCMWYEEDTRCEHSTENKGHVQINVPDTHTSMTHTYLSLIDSMIRRADEKYDLRSIVTKPKPSLKANIPMTLTMFPYIHDFLDTLLPLCRLAYTDLISDETKLVFQKEEFERNIGHHLVQLALKVGLISQSKAPGRFHQQNVSVNFYHKSVQEFLASVHLTCTDTDEIISYCTSLDQIMEVNNIITFMVGIHPSSCCGVSKHVMDIANEDTVIQQHQQTFGGTKVRVKPLYLAPCRWYMEAAYCQAMTGDTSTPPILHVSDIYLDEDSDSNTMRTTEEVMYGNMDNIVSVVLMSVDHLLKRMLQYLPRCPHLSALYITNMRNKEDNDQLVSVIPHLTQLDIIANFGAAVVTAADTDDDVDDILPVYDEADVKAVKSILQLTQLERIGLMLIDFMNECVKVTGDMRQLQSIYLYIVYMSASGWDRFILSLYTLLQAVDVVLQKTNIDNVVVRRICTSPYFKVTADDGKRDEKGIYQRLTFTTVPYQVGEGDEQDEQGKVVKVEEDDDDDDDEEEEDEDDDDDDDDGEDGEQGEQEAKEQEAEQEEEEQEGEEEEEKEGQETEKKNTMVTT